MENKLLKIEKIIEAIESVAPPALQEDYDNAGLIIGDPQKKVSAVLITLDVTEEVIEEAIEKKAGLIIAHHPIIFSGLKKINGKNYVERVVIKAIKNDIAIFAAHTNFDAVKSGVNKRICEKINLKCCKPLLPLQSKLKKLVTFIPNSDVEKVQNAVFGAGAGCVGNYDYCGFKGEGLGSFRAGDNCNPYVGEIGKVHHEKEMRFETIFPEWLQKNVINAMIAAHPYEEVAYDIYSLDNLYPEAGMGMIGELEEPVTEKKFLELIKDKFNTGCIKHTALKGKMVKKVAVCGGAGSFLLEKAIIEKADFFVSADFKYHQFFEANKKIVIADIGHFESEKFTKELFYELLTKKFPIFAVHFSEVNTNPVFYF